MQPEGRLSEIGGYVVADPAKTAWRPPNFTYDRDLVTKPKLAKVMVVIYNPRLKSQGGKTLVEFLNGSDPRKCSHILADAIHVASGGYVTYQIVDVVEVDGFSQKIDGFRYDEASYLAARKDPDKLAHQPDRSSYRAIFEESHLTDRVRREGVTEIWLWARAGPGSTNWRCTSPTATRASRRPTTCGSTARTTSRPSAGGRCGSWASTTKSARTT